METACRSWLVLGLCLGTLSGPSAAAAPADRVADVLRPLDIRHVKLGGEIGRRVEVTLRHNIEPLDVDRFFIRHFRTKTGPDVVGGFIGMGMLIDAAVRLAAYTGDPNVVALKERLVEAVVTAQCEDGYAGFYKPARRLWNRAGGGGDNWDIHEMAFLIDGLVADYRLFGSRRSLDAAVRTADYILRGWSGIPEDYDDRVDWHVLDTGLDAAILSLYRATGAPRFLDFSQHTKSLYDWQTPIVIGRRRGVSGHIFAYGAMCVAQLDLFRLTGETPLLDQTERALDFLLAQDGLTITGCAGQREIWTDDQDGEADLGETCSTAYLIRIYESLLRLTGDALYGDLIERTVYNGLFGAQSPGGEQLRYYTPFEGPRIYYPPPTMCCPGNFRRIIAELPSMAYYRGEHGLTVNLYGPSTATVGLDAGPSVSLRQETDYPSSGRIRLVVSPERPVPFALALRIPAWARGASVRVNGRAVSEPVRPGRFLTIDRPWHAGDTVDLELPLAVRFVRGRRRNAGRVALLRGPIIYGFSLAANPEATQQGKRSFEDLRRLLLDPATLEGPIPDDTVRPGGTALRIAAWREARSGKADRPHEFTLTLTEFPDPNGRLIYFKVPDYRIQVEDELVRPDLLRTHLAADIPGLPAERTPQPGQQP